MGRRRAPKGQFSPEPPGRQDRASEATLESEAARQRGRRPAAADGSAAASTSPGGASMTPSLTDSGATAPVLDEAATAHALHAPVREPASTFADRHIGPDPDAVTAMLKVVGPPSRAALVPAVPPPVIRGDEPLAVPAAASEREVLAELR